MRNELIAGALLAAVAHGPWVSAGWRHSFAGRLTIEIAPSLFYERYIDTNRNHNGHCGLCDIGERAAGSFIVEITIH